MIWHTKYGAYESRQRPTNDNAFTPPGTSSVNSIVESTIRLFQEHNIVPGQGQYRRTESSVLIERLKTRVVSMLPPTI
jgi:hypothetical protein